jgi:hypothetical protein
VLAMLAMLCIIFSYKYVFLFILFCICVASVFPQRIVTWLGVFDINLLVTIWVTQVYGLHIGFIMAHASLIGILLNGDADNVFPDVLSMYLVVALSAYLFTIITQIWVVYVALIAFYALVFIILHLCFGTMEWTNMTWIITQIIMCLIVVKYVFMYVT